MTAKSKTDWRKRLEADLAKSRALYAESRIKADAYNAILERRREMEAVAGPPPEPPPVRQRRTRIATPRPVVPEREREYSRYIDSPTWREKKREFWSQNPKQCAACGFTMQLHVHHMTYERFGGNELMSDLIGLCGMCHTDVHNLHRSSRGISLRAATMRIVKERKR